MLWCQVPARRYYDGSSSWDRSDVGSAYSTQPSSTVYVYNARYDAAQFFSMYPAMGVATVDAFTCIAISGKLANTAIDDVLL